MKEKREEEEDNDDDKELLDMLKVSVSVVIRTGFNHDITRRRKKLVRMNPCSSLDACLVA